MGWLRQKRSKSIIVCGRFPKEQMPTAFQLVTPTTLGNCVALPFFIVVASIPVQLYLGSKNHRGMEDQGNE